MNPLNFKEFVKNRSKDEKLYKNLKNLLTPPLKPNPNCFVGLVVAGLPVKPIVWLPKPPSI